VHDISCASVPEESLPALAAIRAHQNVTVALACGRAWVRWQAGDEAVLRALLPIAGVHWYVQKKEHWHRFGYHLPAFDLPLNATYRPLHHLLTPAPVEAVPPPAYRADPVAIRLTADVRPRPTTALRCNVRDLQRWADSVPSGRLESLRAARCGAKLLLLGSRLPPLRAGERFWGESVLVPLGQRLDPELPSDAIREALLIAADELLLLTGAAAEVISTAALRPLTRAQIRLALEELAS
jgi:hypothetical protein